MNKWSKSMLLFSFVWVTACVTINVYFPAAEVESAAEKFVEEVLREDPNQADDGQSQFFKPEVMRSIAFGMNPINWFVGSAHAQPDTTLTSPAIEAIQDRMIDRMNSGMRDYLNRNIVGFNRNGLVEIVDLSQLSLKDRQAAKKLVADENRDRNALYRELAIANDHPEWEKQIRDIWVQEWIDQAKPGWSYQNTQGQWVKK